MNKEHSVGLTALQSNICSIALIHIHIHLSNILNVYCVDAAEVLSLRTFFGSLNQRTSHAANAFMRTQFQCFASSHLLREFYLRVGKTDHYTEITHIHPNIFMRSLVCVIRDKNQFVQTIIIEWIRSIVFDAFRVDTFCVVRIDESNENDVLIKHLPPKCIKMHCKYKSLTFDTLEMFLFRFILSIDWFTAIIAFCFEINFEKTRKKWNVITKLIRIKIEVRFHLIIFRVRSFD